VLAAEHRVASLGDAAFIRELDEQLERLVGDPVLGVIQEEPRALGDQPLTAIGVLGEQLAEVPIADLGVVALKSPPRLCLAQLRQAARRSDSDLIVPSSSSQDLTNASAPSF
jgi:hypothetical protein